MPWLARSSISKARSSLSEKLPKKNFVTDFTVNSSHLVVADAHAMADVHAETAVANYIALANGIAIARYIRY